MSEEKTTPHEDDTAASGEDHREPVAVTDPEDVPVEEPATTVEEAEAQAGHQHADDEPERLYTKKEVDALLTESHDRFLRVMAEYDNFRRRTAREKEQWIADALEDFVKDLLPVFDSFEKARESGGADEAAAAAMKEGLDVTHKQLRGVLDKYRIEVIDPVGEPFDPAFHEALMRQPSAEHAPGTVVTVFERGYKLGSRLIRPARTVVAAGD